jgi:hypothetical protein
MPSSGMLRREDLVRTDVSKERISIIRMTRLGELGTTLAVTSNRSTLRRKNTANDVLSSSILVTLMMQTVLSPELSVFRRTTRRHISDN